MNKGKKVVEDSQRPRGTGLGYVSVWSDGIDRYRSTSAPRSMTRETMISSAS